MNFDGFGGRLKQAIGSETAYAFAKKCNFAEGLVRKYVSGSSVPGLEKAWIMAKAAGVSLDWLAGGEGPMRPDLRTPEYQEGGYIAKADEFVYVTRWRSATGEDGEPQLIDSRYAFRADWIRANGLDPLQLSLDQARDGAMRPHIHPGDLLLQQVYNHRDGTRIELGLPPGSLPPEDGVYRISLDGATAVRRLQADMTGGVFVSTDAQEDRAARIVPGENPGFRILARVVWAGHVIE